MDPNRDRWAHECAWTLVLNNLLSAIFSWSLKASVDTHRIVGAFARGYRGSQEYNYNLATVCEELRLLADEFPEQNVRDTCFALIDFYQRFLRTMPGQPIRAQYMTTPELEAWRNAAVEKARFCGPPWLEREAQRGRRAQKILHNVREALKAGDYEKT